MNASAPPRTPLSSTDRHASRDPLDDGGQRVEGGDRAIDLAAAVVRHHDPVDAGVERPARVIRMHDALEQHGQSVHSRIRRGRPT
jgi:hypothetical protein